MKRNFLVNFVAAGILLRLGFAASPDISVENGLLENLQAVLLGAELLVLWAGSYRWRDREEAWIGVALTAGLLNLLLRELDLERLPVPAILALVGSGIGRNLLLSLLWLAVLVSGVKRRARLPVWIRHGLASSWGCSLLLGGGSYLLAFVFDQKIIPLAKPDRLFWEEALETIAVLWLGMGVLLWILADKIGKGDLRAAFPK